MNALFAATSITLIHVLTAAVPPDACFQDFRWEDCGKEPKAVVYYWKPGSRCEVGIWRGCRPSFNMFKDEYECVSTCIFTVRAHADDFHNLQMLEEESVLQSQESDSDYDEDSNTNISDDQTTSNNSDNSNNATNNDAAADITTENVTNTTAENPGTDSEATENTVTEGDEKEKNEDEK